MISGSFLLILSVTDTSLGFSPGFYYLRVVINTTNPCELVHCQGELILVSQTDIRVCTKTPNK